MFIGVGPYPWQGHWIWGIVVVEQVDLVSLEGLWGQVVMWVSRYWARPGPLVTQVALIAFFQVYQGAFFGLENLQQSTW